MITLEKLAQELKIEKMELIVAGDRTVNGKVTGSGSWSITGPGKSLSDLGWW